MIRLVKNLLPDLRNHECGGGGKSVVRSRTLTIDKAIGDKAIGRQRERSAFHSFGDDGAILILRFLSVDVFRAEVGAGG